MNRTDPDDCNPGHTIHFMIRMTGKDHSLVHTWLLNSLLYQYKWREESGVARVFYLQAVLHAKETMWFKWLRLRSMVKFYLFWSMMEVTRIFSLFWAFLFWGGGGGWETGERCDAEDHQKQRRTCTCSENVADYRGEEPLFCMLHGYPSPCFFRGVWNAHDSEQIGLGNPEIWYLGPTDNERYSYLMIQ